MPASARAGLVLAAEAGAVGGVDDEVGTAGASAGGRRRRPPSTRTPRRRSRAAAARPSAPLLPLPGEHDDPPAVGPAQQVERGPGHRGAGPLDQDLDRLGRGASIAAISSGVTTGITAAIFLRCRPVEGPHDHGSTLPDGRMLAADDVGDPPAHPSCTCTARRTPAWPATPTTASPRRLGVRLVAVDRPGFGHSTPHPTGTVGQLRRRRRRAGRPPRHRRFAVLAWSAGALPALGIAARGGRRVRGGRDRRRPAAVRRLRRSGGARGGRRRPADARRARRRAGRRGDRRRARALPGARSAHARAGPRAPAGRATPFGVAELESVPGSLDALAAAMVDAVRNGLDGIRRDLELQILDARRRPGARSPRRCTSGTASTTRPRRPRSAAGTPSTSATPRSRCSTGPGHCFPLPRWAELLTTLTG